MEPGEKIRKYSVRKLVNEGSMCNSYFVSDGVAEYFMKEYRDPTEKSYDFVRFYQNQKTLIDRLNKTGSITEKFVDHFVDNGIYYQVKDKLKGINLLDYLRNQLDYKPRLTVSIMFCGILKSLHALNIVHQDLKPEQIMMVDDESGKKAKIGYRMILSDFDFAIPDGKLVRLVGTLYFKSPEHYKGILPTYKSDIYTLGVMLYSFLTGCNPFATDEPLSDEDVGKLILSGKRITPPDKINSDLNEEISRVIIKCLNLNPSDRPEIDEVQTILAGTGSSPVSSKAGKIYMCSGKDRLLIYGNKEISRKELKIFFPNTNDADGNPVHMYFEDNKTALCFTLDPDLSFCVSYPVKQKNYFLLNGLILSGSKQKLKPGDKLEVYSTARKKTMFVFTFN